MYEAELLIFILFYRSFQAKAGRGWAKKKQVLFQYFAQEMTENTLLNFATFLKGKMKWYYLNNKVVENK